MQRNIGAFGWTKAGFRFLYSTPYKDFLEYL
jgi:hypothetical protein